MKSSKRNSIVALIIAVIAFPIYLFLPTESFLVKGLIVGIIAAVMFTLANKYFPYSSNNSRDN